ncbi:MAG: rhodanese-like domain-containing protein [Actinomycetota bacterium]|nr:rhodanese-like domain-containing protein [Actinomycetota bacterium]
MYRDLDAAELAARLRTANEPFLLDVREPDEFAAWSIPSAVNIPLGQLPARLAEVPEDREIVSVCASGSRSASASELLARAGRRVANLSGGMLAWATVYDAVCVELDDVRIVQVRRRGKGCLSYLVGAGGEAFAVDPSTDLDVYLRHADEHGWRITRVFDTHLHADHVSGARALAAVTGATLHLNPADSFEFPFEHIADREIFELPGAVRFEVTAVRTPGHTRGSTIYSVAGRALLTGDTLFVESVGRPDLADRAEPFARDLFWSLHDRVLAREGDTLVLPGHYGDSVEVLPDAPVGATLDELRAKLAPLGYDEEEFVRWATERTSPRPPHYREIVEANMGTSSAPLAALRRLEIGPNRCAVSG